MFAEQRLQRGEVAIRHGFHRRIRTAQTARSLLADSSHVFSEARPVLEVSRARDGELGIPPRSSTTRSEPRHEDEGSSEAAGLPVPGRGWGCLTIWMAAFVASVPGLVQRLSLLTILLEWRVGMAGA